MRLFRSIVACSIVALIATSASAATVTLELEVNGSTGPVVANVGDTLTVDLYATVTDNVHVISGNPFDLGLAGYGLFLFGEAGTIEPDQGLDPLFLTPDGEWDVTFHVPQMAVQTRGNVAGAQVQGHGAAVTSFTSGNATIAANTRTLMATGTFTALAMTNASITIGAPIAANVMGHNGSAFVALPADVISFDPGGVLIEVVPEPGSAALCLLGLPLALVRRRAC